MKNIGLNLELRQCRKGDDLNVGTQCWFIGDNGRVIQTTITKLHFPVYSVAPLYDCYHGIFWGIEDFYLMYSREM